MMYFDTAYLGKIFALEPGSDEVRSQAESAEKISCSAHGRVELAFMFHRKLREGAIQSTELDILWQQVESDEQHGLLNWLPLSQQVLDAATSIALELPTTVFVRAADALHLACAKEHGLREIFSNDTHLLAAADYFGLQGRNVIRMPD